MLNQNRWNALPCLQILLIVSMSWHVTPYLWRLQWCIACGSAWGWWWDDNDPDGESYEPEKDEDDTDDDDDDTPDNNCKAHESLNSDDNDSDSNVEKTSRMTTRVLPLQEYMRYSSSQWAVRNCEASSNPAKDSHCSLRWIIQGQFGNSSICFRRKGHNAPGVCSFRSTGTT